MKVICSSFVCLFSFVCFSHSFSEKHLPLENQFVGIWSVDGASNIQTLNGLFNKPSLYNVERVEVGHIWHHQSPKNAVRVFLAGSQAENETFETTNELPQPPFPGATSITYNWALIRVDQNNQKETMDVSVTYSQLEGSGQVLSEMNAFSRDFGFHAQNFRIQPQPQAPGN